MKNKEIKFNTNSIKETNSIGKNIAKTLKPGDIVALQGEFGAGKTHLIKSICTHFKIPKAKVTSPSFTLIHEYYGKNRIVHLDTYRLKSDIEFEMLDLDYYFDKKSIIFIEWADSIIHLLPKHTKKINISITGQNSRTITYINGDL